MWAQKGTTVSDLTNGRFRVPVPLLYVEEDFPMRERRPNRPKRTRRMLRKVRAWR